MVPKQILVPVFCIALGGVTACDRAKVQTAEANATPTTTTVNTVAPAEPYPAEATASGTGSTQVSPGPTGTVVRADGRTVPTFTLDAGTSVPVRLQETLDTRRNRSGDRFTAALDEPLVSGNRVIVPKGTVFSGHVTEAKPSGRIRGRGMMVLTLDSFDLNGRTYPIKVASAARSTRGHKKRNWLWMGGTAGGGAAIGAVAAGGPGALIGAGAGAGAGFVGAVVTGRKQVALPVESRLIFKLRGSVQIPG